VNLGTGVDGHEGFRLHRASNPGPFNPWRHAVPTELSRPTYKIPYKFETNSVMFDLEGASLSETKGDVTAGCDDLIVIVTVVANSRRHRPSKYSL
jgi:hypothetical protein